MVKSTFEPIHLGLYPSKTSTGKLHIEIRNDGDVQAALDAVQGNARKWTLSVQAIADAIADAATRRNETGLTEELFDNAELIVNPHMQREQFRVCTFAVLGFKGWRTEREQRGWYLTYVGRERIRMWSNGWHAFTHRQLTLDSEHALAIANKVLYPLRMRMDVSFVNAAVSGRRFVPALYTS